MADISSLNPIDKITPTPRKSNELGIVDFIKEWGLSILLVKGASVLGFLYGKKTDKDPMITSAVAGTVAGYIELYRHWSKDKKKQLAVGDLHQEIYNVADPSELNSQLEQNGRIQAGIKQIIADRSGHSHVEASYVDKHAPMVKA